MRSSSLVGSTSNVLALDTFHYFLHLASAVVLLGVGLAADRGIARSAHTA